MNDTIPISTDYDAQDDDIKVENQNEKISSKGQLSSIMNRFGSLKKIKTTCPLTHELECFECNSALRAVN